MSNAMPRTPPLANAPPANAAHRASRADCSSLSLLCHFNDIQHDNLNERPRVSSSCVASNCHVGFMYEVKGNASEERNNKEEECKAPKQR